MARSQSQSQPSSSQPKSPWRYTPLIESAPLSRAAGCRIFLKLENLQPSGSFKSRGVGNFIARNLSPDGSPAHFYCSSGGNAGLAAVTAANSLGQKCTVVCPTSTLPSMIAKLRAVGASEVIQTGANWAAADKHLREVCIGGDGKESVVDGERRVYLPPFDHELVWEGNETLVTEVAEQIREMDEGEPDAIVCSVGGGGLFSGIMQGVDRQFGSRAQVIAVETIGCDSLNQSLKAGKIITLPKISSLATSLGAVRVADRTFECAQKKNVNSVTVTDAEAALGCWRFADDERLLVELACGASLVLAYNGKLKKLVSGFTKESKVVLVVCGGSNVSLQQLADYRAQFGEEAEKAVTNNEEVPSNFTAPA